MERCEENTLKLIELLLINKAFQIMCAGSIIGTVVLRHCLVLSRLIYFINLILFNATSLE
jgi:hypothetical protein